MCRVVRCRMSITNLSFSFWIVYLHHCWKAGGQNLFCFFNYFFLNANLSNTWIGKKWIFRAVRVWNKISNLKKQFCLLNSVFSKNSTIYSLSHLAGCWGNFKKFHSMLPPTSLVWCYNGHQCHLIIDRLLADCFFSSFAWYGVTIIGLLLEETGGNGAAKLSSLFCSRFFLFCRTLRVSHHKVSP